MLRLTYLEYKELSSKQIDQTAFNSLIIPAQTIIDAVTRRHYERNDITKDWEWRANAYKKALAAQVDYFYEQGVDSVDSLADKPQSISLGRTTISYGRSDRVSKADASQLLSFGAELALAGTGLLNRGAR